MNNVRWFLNHFEELVCCVALIVIAVSVFVQVIARYVFELALHWTEEVATVCMVWAVYMGASLCVRERFHIRIMVVVKSLPLKIARFVILLADILWVMFCSFMLLISWSYLEVLWKFPTISPSLGLNQFYPQTIVFIGYSLMLVRLAQTYWDWLRNGVQGLPGVLKDDVEHSDDEQDIKL